MVKRRGKTRKARSNKKRTVRRMRGGTGILVAVNKACGFGSCRRPDPNNPGEFISTTAQTPGGAMKVVGIIEDQISVASPHQWICYGDTFTTCTTVTLVMEDNWKIGAHINPFTYLHMEDSQTLNPVTLLPVFRTLLETHPNFTTNKIKKIYLITTRSDLFLRKLTKRQGLFRKQTNVYLRTLNNNTTQERQKELEKVATLGTLGNEAALRIMLNQVFPKHMTPKTQIEVHRKTEVSTSGDPNTGKHFFILEDGSLDITPT